MPQVQTRNPVFGRALVEALLDSLSAVPVAAGLVTPKVKLFTAGPSPITPDSVPADFTEATFAGYAAGALALPLLGSINIDPNHLGQHNEVDFLAGAVVAPGESILGYWIDDSVGAPTKMYMGEIFETPIPIAVAGDYISLDVVFSAELTAELQPL